MQLIYLCVIYFQICKNEEKAMKIIKTDLRNKVSDEWLNDLMVCYYEKEIFRTIHDD